MATITVTGSVINATTREGMADLRVAVWGRIANADKQLGMTATDVEGHFVIAFNISDNNLSRQQSMGSDSIEKPGRCIPCTTTILVKATKHQERRNC